MTTTIEHSAPAWAIRHETDEGRVRYIRPATAQPTGWDDCGNTITVEPRLIREDEFVVSDDGTASVKIGPVHLALGEVELLELDQAAVLATAITELLDALRGE